MKQLGHDWASNLAKVGQSIRRFARHYKIKHLSKPKHQRGHMSLSLSIYISLYLYIYTYLYALRQKAPREKTAILGLFGMLLVDLAFGFDFNTAMKMIADKGCSGN